MTRANCSDLNQTEHALANNEGLLNLRRLTETKQSQAGFDPNSANGFDVATSLIGNYTCTAFNVHGSKSATTNLQIKGKQRDNVLDEHEQASLRSCPQTRLIRN